MAKCHEKTLGASFLAEATTYERVRAIPEASLGPFQTTMMELFCEVHSLFSQKVRSLFWRKGPS